MSRTGSIISCADPLQNYTSNNLKIGLFRNDSINKKVFYIPVDSTSESLLYDFNLLQGDTIRGYMEDIAKIHFDTTFYAVIDSIDSVIINSIYRKRINYSSRNSIGLIWNGQIIEGIGNTNGLIEGLLPKFDDNGTLYCFSENGTTLYPTFGSPQCNPLTITKNNYSNDITIFPNPTSNSNIELLFDEKIDLVNNFRLDIYNIKGQLMETKFSINRNKLIINIEGFLTGLYFINIKVKNNIIYRQKIIVL